LINKTAWGELSLPQQNGLIQAACAAEKLAFTNEHSTALYHRAVNRALGMDIREQTLSERNYWEDKFSSKVRDGIFEDSADPDVLAALIAEILRTLISPIHMTNQIF